MNLEHRFKICLVLEDTTDETNVIIMGRPTKELFKISFQILVFDKGFVDQPKFSEAILRVKGQCKFLQFQFGRIKSNFGRSDLLIQRVSDDKIELLESSSKLIEMATKMLPLALPTFSKLVLPSPCTQHSYKNYFKFKEKS